MQYQGRHVAPTDEGRLTRAERARTLVADLTPFLSQGALVRSSSALAFSGAAGAVFEGLLLRLAFTSGLYGLIALPFWVAHRHLQDSVIGRRFRLRTTEHALRGSAELAKQLGRASLRRRPPTESIDGDDIEAKFADSVVHDFTDIRNAWQNYLPWVLVDSITAIGCVLGTVVVVGASPIALALAGALTAACVYTACTTQSSIREAVAKEPDRRRAMADVHRRLRDVFDPSAWDLFRRTRQTDLAASELDHALDREVDLSLEESSIRITAGIRASRALTLVTGLAFAAAIVSGNFLLAIPSAWLVVHALQAASRIPQNALGALPGIHAMRRFVRFRAEPSRVLDSPNARRMEGPLREGFSVENVWFTRSDGTAQTADAHLVAGLSFRARPGEIVALVGPNGSGKTTVMNLLQRLDDPTHGRITLDGNDLRELQTDSIDEYCGCIPQLPHILSASLGKNLRLAKPDASDAELEAVARFTGLLGRSGLGGRLSTEKLSGGERKRLEIARLLLLDPPVYLLDEPAAALDAEGMEMLDNLLEHARSRQKVVILATHEPDVAMLADTVVDLDSAKVYSMQHDHEAARSREWESAILPEREVTSHRSSMTMGSHGL